MSNGEADSRRETREIEAFHGLEKAVDAAVSRIMGVELELQEARRKVSEMEVLLRKFTGGEEAPSEMVDRLRRLERENQLLLERMKKGRDGAKRMLARIRFLEEKG